MQNRNLVVIEGNMTRDPELRYTPTGKAVCSFGIAVNEEWLDRDGSKSNSVTFVELEAWGDMAEKLQNKFSKGSAVTVVGKLKVDSWEREGKRHSKMKVLAQVLTSPFAGGRRDSDTVSPERAKAALGKTRQAAQEQASLPDMDEDDVPF